MINNSSNDTYNNNNIKSNNSNDSTFLIGFIIIFIISLFSPIIIYDKIRDSIVKCFYIFLKGFGNCSYKCIKTILKIFRNKKLKIKRINNNMDTELMDFENNEEKESDKVDVKSSVDNINEKKKDDDDDNMFLKIFLGRLIITYYSFYGVIFIYNFAIQFLTLIPGTISKIDCKIIKILSLSLYFIYSIFYSRILLIPTFEFFSFPFIRFKDSLSHLKTFNYIVDDKEFKSEYLNKNNEILNYFLMFIEVFYLISFILGISTSLLTLMDYFNTFIIINYIYILFINH